MPIKSSTAMTAVRMVYDSVEYALWAVLVAFVIYFVIFVAPTMPAAVRQAESARALDQAAANTSYCEKWGMKRGTHEHTLCTMDLQDLRRKIDQENSDASVL
ncbi:MAG TPA: hypothetical protein VKX28_17635 [Xanthobacteraceae bacterium]|nr:hypothetical protein [Xanthobacteraceae bacterium]